MKMIAIAVITLIAMATIVSAEEITRPSLREYVKMKHYANTDITTWSDNAYLAIRHAWHNTCLLKYRGQWLLGTIGKTSKQEDTCFIGSAKKDIKVITPQNSKPIKTGGNTIPPKNESSNISTPVYKWVCTYYKTCKCNKTIYSQYQCDLNKPVTGQNKYWNCTETRTCKKVPV